MSYLLYGTLSRNLTNPLSGCPTAKELLSIIFWSQTNPAVRLRRTRAFLSFHSSSL